MDDLAAPQHHRSGAHRARRHPLLVALVTLGAVAVASAALLWALLAFDVLGVGDELREAAPGALQPTSDASAPAPGGSAAPSAAPSTEASGAPAPSVEASPSAEPEPAPVEADRARPLTVLNSTATPGLAATAGEALGALGWEVAEVGNYDGDETPTAVLYPESDDEQADAVSAATADAVAADLGAGAPTPSADVTVLTVVLGARLPALTSAAGAAAASARTPSRTGRTGERR